MQESFSQIIKQPEFLDVIENLVSSPYVSRATRIKNIPNEDNLDRILNGENTLERFLSINENTSIKQISYILYLAEKSGFKYDLFDALKATICKEMYGEEYYQGPIAKAFNRDNPFIDNLPIPIAILNKYNKKSGYSRNLILLEYDTVIEDNGIRHISNSIIFIENGMFKFFSGNGELLHDVRDLEQVTEDINTFLIYGLQ